MTKQQKSPRVRSRKRVKFDVFTTNDLLLKSPMKEDDTWSIEAIDIVNNLPNKSPSTLPESSKFINFNKTKMIKYTDNEINRAPIFKSVYDMEEVLNTNESCRKHLEKLRWGDEPICQKCGSQSALHKQFKTRGEFRGYYRCKDCNAPFSVTVGTIFENSKIPLRKWFRVISMLCMDSAGTSSYTVHKTLGITQKSAWFILSRIREAFGNINKDFQFDGITQVDETFYGGRNGNRTKDKKVKGTQGCSLKTKSPIFGMVNNSGKVYVEVVPDRKGTTLKPIIRQLVKPGSILVSDGHKGYHGLWWDFLHTQVIHDKGQFKNGKFHTNGIENFWGQLKTSIKGTYKRVTIKHLQRYCNEFAYRYNTRYLPVGKKFNLLLLQADEILRYSDLVNSI